MTIQGKKTEAFCQYLIFQVLTALCLLPSVPAQSQQVLWAKTYPLAQRDAVFCITQDSMGNMYVGGSSARNPYISFSGMLYDKAVITKLYPDGDTAFMKDLGIAGNVLSMAVDHHGMVMANVRQSHTNAQFQYHTYYVWMTSDGFIFKMDSIQNAFSANSCILANDSSIIVAGMMFSPVNPGYRSMYFQRITKDWVIEPVVELNPGHPNCMANRVEQLPNGNYLVSGYVGSRIASYELNPDGSNPVFRQWYQTPDFSNMNSGFVGRIGRSAWSVAGNGQPSIVGVFNASGQKVWLRKELGPLAPPQEMTDSTLVFGYNTSAHPIYRLAHDSSLVWYLNLSDSLEAKGFPNANIDLITIANFDDQSAVFAGRINNGVVNQWDPIFIKIANVGTPVTSLSKPKKGPLQNETLAPWPNPTSGTLYLKQHFDKAEVRLYRLSGQEVGQYRLRFGQPIDVSALPGGLYLYRAVIDGKSYSGKVWRSGK